MDKTGQPWKEGKEAKGRKATSRERKHAIKRLKAKTLLDVFRDTKRVDVKEAHRRFYPDQAEQSHTAGAARDFDVEILKLFQKMIRVDDRSLSKLSNKRVITELMEDLNRLNLMLESGLLTVDEVVKVINAKATPIKLLGMVLGMWKPVGDSDDRDRNDPEKIFAELREKVHGKTKLIESTESARPCN